MFHDVSNGQILNRFGVSLIQKDEIKLDLFRIQKKIDVKKLKHQLWNYIDP